MKRLLTIIALSIAGFAVLATGAFYALAITTGEGLGLSAPTITAPGARTWHNTSPITNSWTTIEGDVVKYQVAYAYDDGHSFAGSTCPDETINGVNIFCRDEVSTSRSHQPADSEQGGVTVWVRAIDVDGNAGAWSKSVHYYFDKTAPKTTLKVEVSGNIMTVKGQATDNLALNRVYVQLVDRANSSRLGGTTINLIPEGNKADWEVVYNFLDKGFSSGTYAAHVEVTDMAGNRGQNGWSENVDIEVTPEEILPPTNLKWITGESNKVIDESGNSTDEYRGTVSWEASPSKNVNKYIYVYWNDIEGSPYKEGSEWTSNINGSLEFNGEFNQGEGDHYFCVKAVNDDGAKSVCSDTFKITYEVKEETPAKDYQLTVSGSVYQDKDGCVGKTTCESRLGNLGEGWVLNLYKEDSTGEEPVWDFIKSTTTDKDGKFKFVTREGEGTYYVCQEEKADWEQQEQTWSGSGYLVNTPNISGNKLEGDYCRKVSFENIKNHSSTGQFGNVDIINPTIEVKGKGNSHTPSSIIVGDFDNHEYIEVSFKLYDAGKIDRLTLNGVEKDLTNNQWSDLNYVKPGEFGAELGENTLVVFDVAGNSSTYVFTLVEPKPKTDNTNNNDNDGDEEITGDEGSDATGGQQESGGGESVVQGGGGGGMILSSFAFGGSSESGEVVGRVLGSTAFQFSKDINIRINSVGPEVKALQIFLNENGFLVAESGPGSKGNETEFFGEKTRDAVIRFQEANDIILQRVEIYNNKGTGNFFWSTKQEANEMLLLNPDLSATILEIVEG